MQDVTISRIINIEGCDSPDEIFESRLNDDRVLWEKPGTFQRDQIQLWFYSELLSFRNSYSILAW
jgi:hypothetical protein